jgi:Uma2 family endonuclease
MVQPLVDAYVFNPADPRAPTWEQWHRMSQEERRRVVAMLPAEVPMEVLPPEGDAHFQAKVDARMTLGSFFQRIGRKIYVSSELAVFYPNEPRFAPDVLAVLDVEPHQRMKWVVQDEGKGLDFVLEVHVAGDASKDFEMNVERYARLGICEYFIFDRGQLRLLGHRLPGAQGPSGRPPAYQRLVPQGGRFESRVLGLDLTLEGSKLRFYYGAAALPEADELIDRLSSMLDEVTLHKDEAERAKETAERAAEEERRHATELAAKLSDEQRTREAMAKELAAARAEIERLKKD